jgi:hypothetical protein
MVEKQKDLVKKVLDESENAIAAIFKLLEINSDHFQQISPAFFSDMKKYHNEVLVNKSNKYEMPDYSNNLEVIERGIKEKLFRREINADLVNRCLFTLFRSTMDTNLYPYEKFSRRDVIRNVVINFLRGISTSEGIYLINKHEIEF